MRLTVKKIKHVTSKELSQYNCAQLGVCGLSCFQSRKYNQPPGPTLESLLFDEMH